MRKGRSGLDGECRWSKNPVSRWAVSLVAAATGPNRSKPLKIEERQIEHLVPYVRNARTHSEEQVAQIAASIAEFGFTNPLLIGADDVIIAGHGRLMAAKQLGMKEVPVIVLDHLSEAQRRALVLADNQIAENAGWDEELLRAELAALKGEDFDIGLIGFDEDELTRIMDAIDTGGTSSPAGEGGGGSQSPSGPSPASSKLAARFGIPPFTVLDARKGWWQDRKRAWIDLGIRSELGRGAAPVGSPRRLDRKKAKGEKSATPGGSALPATNYSRSKARGDGRGRAI